MAVLFWIRSVQNGLNLTKLDFSPIKKCLYKEIMRIKMAGFGSDWIRSVQNGLNLTKLDFSPIK